MKTARMMAVVITSMAVALAGCATSTQSGPPQAGNGKTVTLKFQSLAFQATTIAATKKIVAQWNQEHPKTQVQYLQGSYDSVQSQLVTQFAGGTAPDIIQYDSASMAQFAQQGYLADLSGSLDKTVKSAISPDVLSTVTVNGKVIAAPTLLQSYVVFANKKLLNSAGVKVPGGATWSWDEFQSAAKAATAKGVYGLGWGLNQPTATMMTLGQNFDGNYFSGSGKTAKIAVGPSQLALPMRVHTMAYADKSLDPVTLTQSGSDVLKGFLSGRYAMTVQGSYNAQTLVDSAPKGFDWVVLPPLKATSAKQAGNPQTLSVSARSGDVKGATAFINFFMQPENLAKVAEGDWLIPATSSAVKQVQADTGGKNGWSTILETAQYFTDAPFQAATNYPRWKTEIATPAFQRYLGNKISSDQLGQQLADGWKSVNK